MGIQNNDTIQPYVARILPISIILAILAIDDRYSSKIKVLRVLLFS